MSFSGIFVLANTDIWLVNEGRFWFFVDWYKFTDNLAKTKSTIHIPWDPCLVYLPTFTINIDQNVGKYTIHGSYGYCFILILPGSTPIFQKNVRLLSFSSLFGSVKRNLCDISEKIQAKYIHACNHINLSSTVSWSSLLGPVFAINLWCLKLCHVDEAWLFLMTWSNILNKTPWSSRQQGLFDSLRQKISKVSGWWRKKLRSQNSIFGSKKTPCTGDGHLIPPLMTGILKKWIYIYIYINPYEFLVDEFFPYMEIMGVDRQQLTDPNGLVSAVYRDGTSHPQKTRNIWSHWKCSLGKRKLLMLKTIHLFNFV